MKSDPVLLNYLKRLSPLLKKIVEKAVEEEINIITKYKCCEYLREIGRKDFIPKEPYLLAAGDFPELGLERIIVVPLNWLFDEIQIGSLGLVEICLAHEIGHILTWSNTPFCNKKPTSYNCAYREVLADKVAFDILQELHPVGNLELSFCGSSFSALDLLGALGYPSAFINKCRSCDSLKERQLDNCPKEKEIKKLVKIIKRASI